MRNDEGRKRVKNRLVFATIALFCGVAILFDFLSLSCFSSVWRNKIATESLQYVCMGIAAILVVLRLKLRLFERIEKCGYLFLCLLVAANNFPFISFLQGEMQLVRTQPVDVFLFGLNCLLGCFVEELLFRGIAFAILAELFSKNRKGVLWTCVVSSVIFGIAHLLGNLSLGGGLQAVYTMLIGGAFAFCLIKTKNILCCTLVHAVYNVAGTLFAERGLGTGIVFTPWTIVLMLFVYLLLGGWMLYKAWKYEEREREELYQRLGVTSKE